MQIGTGTVSMAEKMVLIDGHSILNRAFYAIPALSNAEGLPTNAVYGFLNILFKILDEERPQYLAVAFDLKAPTFRHAMFDAYKGTRKPMPKELHEQVPVIKQVLQAMNVYIIEKEGFEADDLIGTMSRIGEEAGMEVSVISGDRDLLQLATSRVKIRIPKTKRTGTEIEDYLEQQVVERYQVTPTQFIELKALMGDASDNIPGVPGVGEKTATKLIVQYHSVDGIYEHLDEMKNSKVKTSLEQNQDLAVLSRKLATICTECPVDFNPEQALIQDFYTQEAYELYKKLEFKNMLNRFPSDKEKPVADNYVEVSGLAQVEEIFEKACAASKTAFYITGSRNNCLVGICFEENEVYYIRPEGFVTSEYLIQAGVKLVDSCKQVIVPDLQEFFLFYPKYAMKYRIDNLMDVSLAAYLINPLQSSYSYEELARQYCGRILKSRSELLGKEKLEDCIGSKPEQVKTYICHTVWVTFTSEQVLADKLETMQMSQLLSDIELPLAATLFRMEQAGIAVKEEELGVYGDSLVGRIEELQTSICSLAGREFNINSPKQLGEVLFEEMKLPNGKKTKTGYSTSAEVLERLKEEHEIIPQILEYRQLTKLKSTYADGLANYIEEDGRIRTTFNQKVTATGRISSTEPNLQNIPVRMELGRMIRKVFVPKEGCVFIDGDYSQIELRVLAHISGDEKLIEAYQKDMDIHRITASEVFHTPLDEVTSLQRRDAKAVNFGIVYGISSFGLSQDLSISRKQAAEYIEKYFATYPKVKEFLDHAVEQAKQEGYVTTMFGRRRPIPELNSGNFMQRSFGERVAMNSPIQGTAADIIKIAMIRVDKRLMEENLKARLLLQVHDELLIEAPEEEVEQVMKILREEMQNAAKMKVSLEVDIHTGQNWYEAK